MRIALDSAENVFGDRVVELLGLLPDEGGTPGVGPEAAGEVVGGADQLGVAFFLAADGFERVVVDLLQVGQADGDIAHPLPWLAAAGEERLLPAALVAVLFLVLRAELLVVAFDGREGLVGDAFLQAGPALRPTGYCRTGCGGRGTRAACRAPGIRARD